MVFLVCFQAPFLLSQEKKYIEIYKSASGSGEYKEGIEKILQWQHENKIDHDTSQFLESFVYLGQLYILKQDFAAGEQMFSSLPTFEPNHYPIPWFKLHVVEAANSMSTGDYRKAKGLYEKINSRESAGNKVPWKVRAPAVVNLGILYYRSGDFDLAATSFHQAKFHFESGDWSDKRLLHALYSNMAGNYGAINDWTSHQEYAQLAYEISVDLYGPEHSLTANSLNTLANGQKQLGDIEGALEGYMRTLSIYDKTVAPDYLNRTVTELNIGESLLKLNRNVEALPHIQATVRHRKSKFGIDGHWVSRAYKSLGDAWAALKDYDKGILFSDTALIALGFDPLFPDDISGVETLFNLFYTTSHRADIFYAKAKHDSTLQSYLDAHEACRDGIGLMNKMRTHYKGRLTTETLNDRSYAFYEPAIAICEELFIRTQNSKYLDTILMYMEDSKNNDFYQITKNEIRSNIPDSILEQEDNLLSYLEDAELEWHDARNSLDSTATSKTQYKMDSTYQVWMTFQKEIALKYPDYFERDNEETTLPVDENVIEYFVGDEHSYAIAFKDGHLHFFNLGPGEKLILEVESFRSRTIRRTNTDSLSHSLFEYLLQPMIHLFDENESITIIPDGVLAYLPFETLKMKGGDFIVNQHFINYKYSLSNKNKSTGLSKSWLGISPQYPENDEQLIAQSRSWQFDTLTTRSGWLSLPGAQQEVKNIQSLTRGDVWLGNEASETNFYLLASNYGILHLSMHAWLDNEDPMHSAFIFSADSSDGNDNKMHAYELIHMKLPSQMAVLSACNTGTGKMNRGEGVFSLARIFARSGTKSTVMSLWTAPDQATKVIMNHFYKELVEGVPKNKALALAKRAYLSSVNEPGLQHPYYWAGFVLQGDISPIKIKKQSRWIYWVFGLLLSGLLFIVFSRINQKSSAKP